MLKTGHGLSSSLRILFQLQLQETSIETQAAQQPLQLHSTWRAFPKSRVRIPTSHLQRAFLRPRGYPSTGVRSQNQERHHWGRRAGSGSAQRLDAGAWPPLAFESLQYRQSCVIALRLPFRHYMQAGIYALHVRISVPSKRPASSFRSFPLQVMSCGIQFICDRQWAPHAFSTSRNPLNVALVSGSELRHCWTPAQDGGWVSTPPKGVQNNIRSQD